MANILALTLALVVIAAGGSVGMVGAQSSSSCSAALVSFAPCLAFLHGGANNSSPTQGCCTGLASVVSTTAACLCQMVTTTNNPLGIPINQTQALALPGACKITTTPVSQCKSTSVSTPPAAAAPSSPTPVVGNPTPTAKSPATSAALPPTTTPDYWWSTFSVCQGGANCLCQLRVDDGRGYADSCGRNNGIINVYYFCDQHIKER